MMLQTVRRVRPFRIAILLAVLAWLTLPPPGGSQDEESEPAEILDVGIKSPPPAQPQFGNVELIADVYPQENAARVEFYVDGRLVGELEGPPFTVRVDVGQENREHRFEVKAYSASEQLREALLVSPAIHVDSEITAELQQLYVTATRGESRVLNLAKDDFAIIDNGNRQELVTFARGDVRLTATILIDSSASMRGERLRYALRGATAFVDGIKPTDDAAILLFSDRLLHSTPFSHDTALLTSGLDGVRAAGGTALNDHFYLALKLLEHEQGRRVVVLLSDGIDSHSALRMSEVTWLARRSRALVYWLRTDPGDESQKSRSSAWKSPAGYRTEYQQLTRTILETGGRVITLQRIQDAEDAFREILEELREQYVLGYYPTVSRGDGSWHRVTVRVRKSGLQIRTRGGYVDY
ncbi:MAG: VWA domain-containing protein [bacterium]|nr:VWA domain-containing protein [bacterium]